MPVEREYFKKEIDLSKKLDGDVLPRLMKYDYVFIHLFIYLCIYAFIYLFSGNRVK